MWNEHSQTPTGRGLIVNTIDGWTAIIFMQLPIVFCNKITNPSCSINITPIIRVNSESKTTLFGDIAAFPSFLPPLPFQSPPPQFSIPLLSIQLIFVAILFHFFVPSELNLCSRSLCMKMSLQMSIFWAIIDRSKFEACSGLLHI